MAEDTTLQEAMAGDAGAFDALVGPLLDPAYRLAIVLLHDRSEAEDAVQEAALKAWAKLGQLRGDRSKLRSWFLSVVANECRMSRRRGWWNVLRLPESEPARSRGEDDIVQEMDLERAIARLPEDERLALFTHFYLDLSLEESARVLGLSLGATKSRIYRAARRLRPGVALEEVMSQR